MVSPLYQAAPASGHADGRKHRFSKLEDRCHLERKKKESSDPCPFGSPTSRDLHGKDIVSQAIRKGSASKSSQERRLTEFAESRKGGGRGRRARRLA